MFSERKRFSLPKVGMRMSKTALAVLLALILEPILLQSNGFYGGIAAIICMKKNWQDSYTAGRDRILATLIGGFSGWLFLEIDKLFKYRIDYSFSLPLIIRSLLLAVVVLVVIYLTTLMEESGTSVLSCVVFLSISINHANDITPLSFAIMRVLSTILGILIAVFVDRLLPNKTIQNDISLIEKYSSHLFDKIKKRKD